MADLSLEVLDKASREGASHVDRQSVLSAREAEVLGLVAEGLLGKEVAARLFITERTVRYHLTSVFGKLGADNRTQAVRLAEKRGLL